MTITMTREHATGRGGAQQRRDDVRARREAALDRLSGGQPRQPKSRLGGRIGTPGRGSVARTKPSRRATQRTTPKIVEQLGPAPAVYYAIVVIIAAFVMLACACSLT